MSEKPTIKDVAKAAGVSEATVSRALSHSPRVKRATRQKVQEVANRLGYRPNSLARGIRVKQTHTLGMIIPDILNDYFTQLTREIEDAAGHAGYDVLIMNTDESLVKEAHALNLMLEKQVDGVIIASAGGQTDYARILGTTPAIFVDRMPPANIKTPYDRVIVDNVKATCHIVSQLLAQGATRVGIINSAVSFTATERLAGYQQALHDSGIALDSAIEVAARTDNSNVQQMTRQLLINQKCDGLFVGDNTIMEEVLRKLTELNLPHLQLGGFDDQMWFDFLPRPIVTARQPIKQLGQTVVDRLLAHLADPQLAPQEIRLDAQIITRQ
ncbi:catabolite control protein A [Levilactobacillus koreensis JCM 16448]|uniref:Catabolite control protein A n=1 Tax=Levilactobacillus koreensis TaxID=637971 RepID=A0AAC8UVP4_9LACO|nr:LacI family DNA-binding transcriptional regulator [Levilactobacillus koreensis]AKP64264.1 catabolite control protein A [Levilactobacillus koreensis]KRK87324.1 catabolite control protein A [Levilactobacillus koreensis JCM 16448]